MQQYLDLLVKVYTAPVRSDRTGVGTSGVFGHQMRFNMADGFPMLTTKRLPLKAIVHELLWFLMGDTNVKYLQDNGVRIWDEWADENGDLGPVYGKQWRDWPKFKLFTVSGTPTWVPLKVDQIEELVEGLKNSPFSRRHMVSAWNPAEISSMKLPPCHCLFQCYVREQDGVKYLDLQLYQRSADVFLGVPFNIASYSLLLMMLAQVCGYQPGEFIWTGGDTHLYLNHRSQAEEQLLRTPKKLPTMVLNPAVSSIFDFKYEDFQLKGYDPDPTIHAEVAV